MTETENTFYSNLNRLHTTPMGAERINRNIGINTADPAKYLKEKIKNGKFEICRKGKNFYCQNKEITVTVNAGSFTVITAHKTKRSAK